jgi:hypothetical protein
MRDVAHAIGEASIRWGDIEFVLHDLCINLAKFHDRQFEQAEAAGVMHTVLSVMDVRQRVAAAKALAAGGLDPDLYATTEKLLNYIDNDLRNERNRFVHDNWQERDGKIVRTKHGVRVVRPQSRMLEVQYSTAKEFTSVADVRVFADTVSTTLRDLIRLDDDLTELYQSIWPPEGLDELAGGA